MDIVEARKHLTEQDNKKYSDQEVQEIINSLSVLADIALDKWFSLTPEERKRFHNKKNK